MSKVIPNQATINFKQPFLSNSLLHSTHFQDQEIDEFCNSTFCQGNFEQLYADISPSFYQINSVSQLEDIKQNDWRLKSLNSLAKRYHCFLQYTPTLGTISRYQFAINLKRCIQKINQVTLTGKTNPMTKEDIIVIQRLQQEFTPELNLPGNQVNLAIVKPDQPESPSFSTTTKLNAEAILVFIGSNQPNFKGNRANRDRLNTEFNQPALGWRTTLNFDTSFNGRDNLRTRFRGGSITPPFLDQTNMGGWETSSGLNGNVRLTKLQYRSGRVPFIYGESQDKLIFVLSAFGTGLDETFFETFNPYIIGTKDGFTEFAVYNPIFRQPQGVGGSIGYTVSERFKFAVAYQSRGFLGQAGDPAPGRGLFNGSFSTGVNTQIQLTKKWIFSLTYLYSYSAEDRVDLLGGTGSDSTNDPFNGNPTIAHNFGLQTTALVTPKFNLAGWLGWTRAFDTQSNNEADIINWALTFAFLDAFKQGNKAGFIIGMPPKLTHLELGNPDPNNAWQFEAFYTHQVTNNIFFNPGFYVIVNPENDSRNDTIFVGVMRTTFEF